METEVTYEVAKVDETTTAVEQVAKPRRCPIKLQLFHNVCHVNYDP